MNKYLIVIVCMMFLYSCSEEKHAPVTNDSTIPGQVSNVTPESLPGAVRLTYDLPSGQNLLYVKAECLINGVMRQVKTTSNSLTIEGFADTETYTVNLYSVNRSEKESEPVTKQVQPLMPPFQKVFENLKFTEDWGGVSAFFDNPDEADLSIVVIRVDSTGFWNDVETFYTKRQQGQVSVRGLKPRKAKFGVYIRDRWNNTTDTLIKDLTPKFEKLLDISKFREVRLPSDAEYTNEAGGYVISCLWDNFFMGDPAAAFGEVNGQWPLWFTFDLGCEQGVTLSRFRLWHRGTQQTTYHSQAYNDRAPRKFEVWGSMNPDPDGTWDSWTLLLDAEMIKPSGLPIGVNSEEDMQAFFEGNEFIFPLDIPDTRYIRMKVTETWGNQTRFIIDEVRFWGQEPSDITE